MELFGWVLKNRMGRFILLHDKHGFIQARMPPGSEFQETASSLKTEDVLRVVGRVTSRGKDVNPEMETGEIDVS